MDRTVSFLANYWSELWHILLESGVWLILGLGLAGLVHAFVPRSWFTRHLGGRGIGPIAKASLLGIPMPLCSCSVIPVAAGLRTQGAGKGATAAFAISTPQTGEESIPITWALFGPVFALARPVIAVVTAFVAGLAINAIEREDAPTPETPGPIQAEQPPAALGEKLRIARRHGFGTMLRDLAPWLTWGILVAALVGALVPPGWIAEHVGTGLWPKLLMLVIGIPVYICATSSTPLAYSLVMAGLSPGAAIVLLLVGPAVNVATMSWVIKDLGVRALVVYIAVIGAVALGAGTLFDVLLAHTMVLADGVGSSSAGGPWAWAKAVGAAALVTLLAHALVTRYWPGRPAACCAAKPAAPSCCASKPVQISLPTASCCSKTDAPSCGCSKD